MKNLQCVLISLLVALGAAAFEVPPVKQWPKEKIPSAHAGRILHWEGIDNVRDLGGVKTLDGRRVRRGLVYRSQAFNFNAVCSWMAAERMERKLRNGQFRYDFGEACMKTMLDRIGTNDLSKSCVAIAAEIAAGTNAWKRGPSRLTPESRAKILRETGLRTAKAFDNMVKKAFRSKPGTSFNEKIEAFALECGFTAADIAKFRSIMLK